MQIVANQYSATSGWLGAYDEAGIQAWAEQVRASFQGPQLTLGLVFMTPHFFERASQVLEILRVHARIPLLVGCSGPSLATGAQELEDQPGIALGLYHLPGATIRTTHFVQAQVEEANGPGYWHHETGVDPDHCNGWLAFADPFRTDCETWLRQWNEAYSPLPILGGLAGGGADTQASQLYLNGEVFDEGGVALSVQGDVRLQGVISQGCTPIGETWTITKTDGNLIHEIGKRPAYQVLADTFSQLNTEQQKRAQGNLMVGLVINEYQEEFHRGDFLIRSLLGGDPSSGILAVGARPRVGQSLQFQCRDAEAADEDMKAMLEKARAVAKGSVIYGACLCSCNGRGHRLFGRPHHDAALAQDYLGPMGLTGFFCNGEIGPVGGRSFLHGYTASLALFMPK